MGENDSKTSGRRNASFPFPQLSQSHDIQMGRASGATQTTVNSEVHRGRVENMNGGWMEGRWREWGRKWAWNLAKTERPQRLRLPRCHIETVFLPLVAVWWRWIV
jgi:hypothetical protein